MKNWANSFLRLFHASQEQQGSRRNALAQQSERRRETHRRRFHKSAPGQLEVLESRCLLAASTPLISVSDMQVIEGTSGSTRVAVEVSLDAVSDVPVTITYTLESGTASVGTDIQAVTGTLTIPAGTLSGQIVTSTMADAMDELDETAIVTLSNPKGGVLSKAVGTITILDDDLPPTVSVANVIVTEGESATIMITMSEISSLPVTVWYRTAGRTATALLDFTPVSSKVTIPAGATTASVTLLTLQDTLDERNEAFTFLFKTVNSPLVLDQASSVGILDDDPPALTISDATVAEVVRGAVVQLIVTASSASPVPITASFGTSDETATGSADYRTATGSFTIPAGSTRAVINLSVLDDRLFEVAETFLVTLSAPVNATVGRATAIVRITDNDPLPVASIANAVTTEGDVGDVAVVSLNTVSGAPVTISFVNVAFTTTAGVDFIADPGTITIPAGQLSVGIPLRTIEDTRSEPDESFRIGLSNPIGATLLRAVNIVTILDDDTVKLPLFEPADMSYLGAFQVPAGQNGSATFEYSGTGLTYNPARNSLFMAAEVNRGLHVAEISIPDVLSNGTSLAGMPVTSVLQPFVDLGRLLTTDAGGRDVAPVLDYENLNLGGLLVAGGGLTGGMYMGYTGAEPVNSTNSHFRTSSLNLAALTAADMQGLIDVRRTVTSTDARIRGGYMAEVPAMWRPYINATHVTGAAGQNRIQFSSSGPALFGFNAVTPRGSSSSALLAYPSGYPLQWSNSVSDGAKPIFNGTTKVDGVAFVPGTRSIIFIGSNGLSSIGYGNGALFNDQARPYSGYHSQNGAYAYQIWAYDIDDFMAVRNGLKTSWDLRPTSVVNFDLPTPEPAKYLGGVAFDPATSRLYISQKQAGPSGTPVIHVYRLGRQSSGNNGLTAKSLAPASKATPVTRTSSSGVLSIGRTTLQTSATSATTLVSAIQSSTAASASQGSATTVKSATPASNRLGSVSSSPTATASLSDAASRPPVSHGATDAIFASLSMDLTLLN